MPTKCYLTPPIFIKVPLSLRLQGTTMTSLRLVILAFALLATLGCRTRPETRAMFEAYQEEARRLEGVIYRLQYERDTACQENERLKKQLAQLDSTTPRRT